MPKGPDQANRGWPQGGLYIQQLIVVSLFYSHSAVFLPNALNASARRSALSNENPGASLALLLEKRDVLD